MSKKSKKKKGVKKLSAKKEKYLQFRKEKPTTMDLTPPELTPEQQKRKQEDEMSINRFWKFSKNPPTKEIKEKKIKYK